MDRIPKSFQLGSVTIHVLVVSDAELKRQNTAAYEVNGLWDAQTNTIYLRRAGKNFPKEKQIHCFWHEFFHALFEILGYDKLSAKEQLVDQCALLMQQAQETMKYR